MLKVGDTCTVHVDWGSGAHRGKRVQILKIYIAGGRKFAKVFWKGEKAKALTAEYGDVFSVDDELRKA